MDDFVKDINVPTNDCISRQAAIDLIESIETERLKGNIELIYAPAIKGLRALPPAQPEIKQQAINSSDCIDRRAALDAIRPIQTYKLFEGDDMILIDKAEVQTELMLLPSAQPEQCEDAVSRKTIIKFLDSWMSALEDNVHNQSVSDLKIIKKDFENLPSAQPEIVRCKDCKYWVPGYITDNDDFIPPKCGEWQQMVGHSSDDYCSLAERREVTNGN